MMEGDFRFLAEESKYYYHLFMQDDSWTRDKLRDFFTFCYPNPEHVQNALRDVDAILKKYPNEEINAPQIRNTIKDDMAVAFNSTLRNMDTLSQVAMLKPYTDVGNRGMVFKDFSPHFYMAPWEGSGNFGYVTGPPGKYLGVGKTDTACLFAEMAMKHGKRVQTNILIKDKPEGLTEVRTLSDVMGGAIQNMLDGKITLTILDEAPQFLEKERATSKGNVNMKKAQYLMRKIGNDLMVIAQRDKEVSTSIMEMARSHIQKLDKTEMIYRRERQTHVIKKVPGTSLKFSTGDMAGFVIDLDISDMHDYIVSTTEGESQFQAILDYIRADKRKVTDHERRICAKVMYSEIGFTQKEIAELLGVKSQGTISQWLSKLEKGKGVEKFL
jgi:DNA-binding XRE family transcriptional regulator